MPQAIKVLLTVALLLQAAVLSARSQPLTTGTKIGLGGLAAGAAALVLGDKNSSVLSTSGTASISGLAPGTPATLAGGSVASTQGPLAAGGAAGTAGATATGATSQSSAGDSFFSVVVTSIAFT